MLIEYLPAFLLFLFALGLAVFFSLCSVYLGPKRISKTKLEPFECGHPSDGFKKERFSIKFYVVALLFLVFDIEAVFFFPWATIYRELSRGDNILFGFFEMGIFIFVLAIALFYVWKKGGLEWD